MSYPGFLLLALCSCNFTYQYITQAENIQCKIFSRNKNNILKYKIHFLRYLENNQLIFGVLLQLNCGNEASE